MTESPTNMHSGEKDANDGSRDDEGLQHALMSEDQAATLLQSTYRGYAVRKANPERRPSTGKDSIVQNIAHDQMDTAGDQSNKGRTAQGEEANAIISEDGQQSHLNNVDEGISKIPDPIPATEDVSVGDVKLTGLDKESPLSEGYVRLNLYINPDDFQYSIDARPDDSIYQLKERIFQDIKAPIETQSLRLGDGQDLSNSLEEGDKATLASLGFEAGQSYEMELFIKFNVDRAGEKLPYAGLPEVFNVEVDLGHGEIRKISVRIEKDIMGKPFLGGYRSKKTGIEYHHAGAQTIPKKKSRDDHRQKNHRDTQTYQETSLSQQTMRELGIQTKRPGIRIEEEHDRIVQPQGYFTSEQLFELQNAMALKIQCQIRRFFALRRANQLRHKREQRETELRNAEAEERRRAEEHRRKEIQRRMHPQSTEDFEILYQELEAWHRQETIKVEQSNLSEEERQTALYQLLVKETKLLQTIDRLKIVATKENRDKHIKNVLASMSKPKEWPTGDGDGVEVHTPFSTRAKELMELYNGLRLPLLTVDERLDVLLHVKWTVKEFDCNLTREIVDLIDREADMLNRGRSEKSLEGLRKRLNNLFFQFIETPEFNPEASRFQRVPRQYLNKANIRPLNDRVRKR